MEWNACDWVVAWLLELNSGFLVHVCTNVIQLVAWKMAD